MYLGLRFEWLAILANPLGNEVGLWVYWINHNVSLHPELIYGLSALISIAYEALSKGEVARSILLYD